MKKPDGIRPSVLLIAAGLAGLSALILFVGVDAHTGPEGAHANAGRSHHDRASGSADRTSDRSPSRVSEATGEYQHHNWGRESELSRRLSLGLPDPNFWQNQAERGAPANDPQLAAMWRSYRAQATDGEPDLPFEPTAQRARLIQAEGDVNAAPSSCDVRVLPVRSGGFNCVVRVMCDGAVLYPNSSQSAGYVPCEVENGRPVRAIDEGSTARDGDPLVSLDLRQGTVTVEDFDDTGARRYRATLRLEG
ncbi:MAG: hypothetical protein AB8I08_15505 [Sandaracinaceae bacterium]